MIKKNGISFGASAWTHIEISDHCNLRCRMCEQSGELEWHRDKTKVHPQPRAFMSFELWKKIIDDFVKMGVKFNEIDPFWMGESLINPDFPKMMDYLKQVNEKYELFYAFKLHTNALNLTKENSEAILNCCMAFQYSRIVFSIDAIKPGTFKTVKKVDGMSQVNQNIKSFIKLKLARKQVFPKLLLQFIVLKENEAEVEEFIQYWTNFLSSEGLGVEICSSHSDPRLLEPNNKVIIYFEKENTSPSLEPAALERYMRVIRQYGK